MTDLRTAAQQALEALEVATNCLDGYYIPRGKTTLPEIEDAITALRAALAEPVQESKILGSTVTEIWNAIEYAHDLGGPLHDRIKKLVEQRQNRAQPTQEPVAWLTPKTVDSYMRPDLGYETCSKTDYAAFPVYTAPPQRKPLTEEEIWRTYKNLWMFHPAEEPRLAGDVLKFARAIERAHGIGGSDE